MNGTDIVDARTSTDDLLGYFVVLLLVEGNGLTPLDGRQGEGGHGLRYFWLPPVDLDQLVHNGLVLPLDCHQPLLSHVFLALVDLRNVGFEGLVGGHLALGVG